MIENGENCLEMLHEVVVPRLQTKPNFDELFFQQNEASSHSVLRAVVLKLGSIKPRGFFESVSGVRRRSG